MTLRFHEAELKAIAANYAYRLQDTALSQYRTEILKRGYLTKAELRAVAKWKAPRSAGHIEKNSEEFVKEITGFALSTQSERARIESLTLLDGVRWPSASVILHFFHKNPYPILDYRALWSLNTKVPNQYRFNFWMEYVEICRDIAGRNGLSMRTLDKALWQYSKENQPAEN